MILIWKVCRPHYESHNCVYNVTRRYAEIYRPIIKYSVEYIHITSEK